MIMLVSNGWVRRFLYLIFTLLLGTQNKTHIVYAIRTKKVGFQAR